jgi:hypothetical protein
MKPLTLILKLLLALSILIVAGIALVKCDKSETIIETEYVYDTTLINIETEVPVPYKITITDTIFIPYNIHTSDTVILPLEIDTMAILSDYYSKVEYRDTIEDESIKIFLNESISQNRIISRDLSYKWMKPTQVITYDTKTNIIYGGLPFWQNIPSNTSSILITLSYANEKMFGSVGYDPINSSFKVEAGLKLFKW